jgi:hypothetical protein
VVAVVVVEGLAILFLGLLVVGLLRSHADILRSLHELGAGLEDDDAPARGARAATSTVPVAGSAYDVSGTLPDDSAAAVAVVGAGQDTVLAFLSTTCLSCEPFWETFARPFPLPDDHRLVVVVQEGDNVKKLRRISPPDLLVVRSDDAWRDYDVPGSPHFVHVSAATGTVTGEGTGDTWEQVLDLLTQAAQTDPRDNAERIDRELLASGIGPGHPSLFTSLDQPDEGVA